MTSLERVSIHCGLTMLQNKLMILHCRKDRQMTHFSRRLKICYLFELMLVKI